MKHKYWNTRNRNLLRVKEFNEGIQYNEGVNTVKNLCTTIQVGGCTFPIVVRIIDNMTCPLILGKHYRHLHTEILEVQQVNRGNLPKRIFHVREGYKKRTPNMTNKALCTLYIDLVHGSYEDMTMECTRSKVMNRTVGVRISATIQECNSCTNQGNNFKTGKQEIKEGFNINVMVRCKPVRNLRKFDQLISITNIFTGLTAAKRVRFIDSTRTSLNKLVNNVWVHGEHRGSFG